MNDLKYAFRQLSRTPGFTLVAVLSLTLGIGANTAIFSLVNAVLLRSLPVPNPQELRVLKWTGSNAKIGLYSGAIFDEAGRTKGDAFSYAAYAGLKEEAGEVARIAGCKSLFGAAVRADREAFVATGSMVSDNFFSVLGVRPLVGRLLSADDGRSGAPPATVISYSLWEREFGLDPEALGRSLLINGHPFTVIGILPRAFHGVRPSEGTAFYVPLSAQPELEPRWSTADASQWWLQLLARRRAGISDALMQSALEVAFAHQADALMEKPELLVEDGSAGPDYVRQRLRTPLLLLLGVVGLVILVACANLAGLSLARGTARKHEFAIRAAIGAGRWRLMRQSFAESLTLSFLGAGLGTPLAFWGKDTMARLLAGSPEGLHYDTRLDASVLAFTLGITLVTTVMAGLLPALRASHASPASGLRSHTVRSSPRLGGGRFLVVTQVALSMLLLTAAALYGKSLLNLVEIDPGFNTENILLFRLDPHNAGYEGARSQTFFDQVLGGISRIPGVRSATLTQFALLSNWRSDLADVKLPGKPAEEKHEPRAQRLSVSEQFFETMGIPMLQGRGFEISDRAGAPKVVVVNSAFAREYFQDESPLGKTMEIKGEVWRIVGVCTDAVYSNLKLGAPPTVYFSFRQDPIPATYVAVRTALPPLALTQAVRKAVAEVNPNVPIASVSTQEELRAANMSQERLFAALCGGLAFLATLLSWIGLYGLLAYSVTRRFKETGIRMALGARPLDVAIPIVREGLLLALCGIAIAVPVTFGLEGLIKNQLYNVSPNDPLALVLSTAGLLLVALAATSIPAFRASRVDPMEAVRYE